MFLEDLQRFWWEARRKPLECFLMPVAAADGWLLCRDCSLVSLFRIDGSRALAGEGELERFVDIAARRLNSRFTGRGHALHVTFERVEDRAVLEEACESLRRKGERLGLELSDVMAERSRRPPPALESLLVACWTRPSAASPVEKKRDSRERKKRLKAWLPDTAESQCAQAGLESLAPRHDAVLEAVDSMFGECGLIAARLSSEEAVAAVRRGVDGVTPVGWRAYMAGDGAHPRAAEPAEWGVFPPPLAPQILDREPERVGSGVALGERLYGTLDMTLGPRNPRPFSEFLERLSGLPFRLSLLLEGGGLGTVGAKAARIGAAFLAFSSDDTRAVRDGLDEVGRVAADAQAVVRLRVSIATWVAREEGPDALVRRLSQVQQLAEGWGECVFSPLVGDPMEALAGTIAGFACGGTAPAAYVPFREVLGLWPVGRPAPLSDGADHVFRSLDNKMLPFSYATGGDYLFELIHGLPGRGKSVLMNCLTLAHVLQGERLPLAVTIDIGPSSAGLISMIREALPESRRREAGWFRLRMSAAFAINPLDTPLGCRSPLAAGRAFLENFLGVLLTPPRGDGVPDGMRELVGPLIEAAYEMRSDERAGSEPHFYTEGRDGEVDEALTSHGCRLPERALWWDAVDALFMAGEPEIAARAQRYAVPVLPDLISAVREPAVQGVVKEARYGAGGEPVTDAFIRVVTGLASSWPALFHPTAFETGGARVAAIDLSEVAPTGSAESDRQSAVFYMVAREMLTRDWWTHPDEMEGVPPLYREWHVARAHELREAPKRIAYDEFHRTAGAPAVRAQVDRDVREARKMRVRIVLASQSLSDFGHGLVERANRYWILGVGGEAAELSELSEVFGLSETAAEVVRHELNGPGPGGAPALLIAEDERGRFEQVLVNAPGPVELWALNTSPRDVALRDRVSRQLSPSGTRAALAVRFPGGSAVGEMRDAEKRGERDFVDRIAAEVVEMARRAPEGRMPGAAA